MHGYKRNISFNPLPMASIAYPVWQHDCMYTCTQGAAVSMQIAIFNFAL